MRSPRPTANVLRVISAILDSPGSVAFGQAIAQEIGLASGTLYPMLLRLEDAGWLTSEWEVQPPQELGRPRRRLYRVTGLGATEARRAAMQVQQSIGRLAWS